jgi:hypothetical protein
MLEALGEFAEYMIVAHIDPPEHYQLENRNRDWWNAQGDTLWFYEKDRGGWRQYDDDVWRCDLGLETYKQLLRGMKMAREIMGYG